LERQVIVADSITDVARAEVSRVSSGEAQETRVSETTHNGDSLSGIALYAPFFGGINGVKEIVNENVSLAILLLLFISIADNSEVRVARKVEILL